MIIPLLILHKEKPKKRPRTLRSYRRVANKDHGQCQQCGRQIKVGEEYDAYVVVSNKKLRVDKFHVHCPEDFWEEEDEKAREADAKNQRADVLLLPYNSYTAA